MILPQIVSDDDVVRGFIKYKRGHDVYRDPKDRVKDFKEISARPSSKELQVQAARCMDCGVPFCQSNTGCPIGNVIPKWNEMVYQQNWKDAYHRLMMTNNFPGKRMKVLIFDLIEKNSRAAFALLLAKVLVFWGLMNCQLLSRALNALLSVRCTVFSIILLYCTSMPRSVDLIYRSCFQRRLGCSDAAQSAYWEENCNYRQWSCWLGCSRSIEQGWAFGDCL
jgi:hypothetical protein